MPGVTSLRFADVDSHDPDAVDAWARVPAVAMLQELPDEAQRAARRRSVAGHRLRAAFDGDEPVGTLRSFDTELTLPGAGPVTVDAVSSVGVLPTHRRRGVLRHLLGEDLHRARETGHALAALIAMEAPIYGRFGFGAATRSTTWTLDADRAALRPDAPTGGTLRLVDPRAGTDAQREVHDRARRSRAGGLERDGRWWDERFAVPSAADRRTHLVVHSGEDGHPDGYALYELTEAWAGRVPRSTARVLDLTATTTAAYADLWRFVASVDLVRSVSAGDRPEDELLPHLLADPRAAQQQPVDDFLWLRVLDVPGALCARRYLGRDSLVLRVVDPDGLAGGTVRLTVEGSARTPDGWTCGQVETCADEPDVTLGVAELGTLLLGGGRATALAAAGRLVCASPDRAWRLDALLATPEQPWCPTWF